MKNEPIIGKEDVVGVVREALMAKVGKVLDGYNSPLDKIIHEVIVQHDAEFRGIIQKALEITIKDKQFVSDVNVQFKHKIAKVLVGKMEGAVEKAADRMRQDPSLRARMIIAIEEIIKE
jgi:hypothetical protein